jgi:hypothetical protein
MTENGWLTPEDRADVERLVERKLKKHGGGTRPENRDLSKAQIPCLTTLLGNRFSASLPR